MSLMYNSTHLKEYSLPLVKFTITVCTAVGTIIRLGGVGISAQIQTRFKALMIAGDS